MAATAAHKVLFITELVEDILVQLPLRLILVLQRVCKGWKKVVEGSVKLQRMLFFLPIGPAEENPKPTFIVNPMTEAVYHQIEPHIRYASFRRRQPRSYVERIRKKTPVLREHASWKRMFLTQPPFQALTLHSQDEWASSARSAVFRKSFFPEGTMVGDFFQHCESFLQVSRTIDYKSALGRFRKLENYAQLKRLSK